MYFNMFANILGEISHVTHSGVFSDLQAMIYQLSEGCDFNRIDLLPDLWLDIDETMLWYTLKDKYM
jgi:hypothetical protein